jgi:predicted nucleic acid-binding protein
MAPPLQAVLDTNIVLDLFLFQDPRTQALRQRLQSQTLNWIATPHMRNELERVLTYAHIAAKLAFYQLQAQDILSQFDRWASLHTEPCGLAQLAQGGSEAAPANPVSLISKDKAVLSMRKRLLKLSVYVSSGAEV